MNETKPIIDSVEALETELKRLRDVQTVFAGYTQEQVDKIFLAAATAADKARIPLAKMAVEETGMGIVEDKVIKNHYAAEYIYNAYKDTKTCGIIEEDKSYGIKKVAEPIGVVAAVIPTTNPTSTAIFKTLIALKTRNAIIISPHPRAKKSTIAAAKVVLDAAVAAGAPEGIISWIDVPSLDLTNTVMKESDIILATGGPGMVKAAYSSGKPAIGVGAGNTPAIIDDSADLLLAVNSIIHSKTFDNGMICASEQSVIVMKNIYDAAKKEFARRGCYFLDKDETEKVRKTIIINGALNAKIVGQKAHTIAALSGVEVPEDTKILIGEVTSVDISEEFAHEKLSPVLAMYKAKDFDDALSVRKLKDNLWEVGVHIADVTHYVRPHSVIDDEAVERGTSVYLVDRTVPMLPERLSNELCSLRPHETSLCFSAVFTLNENLDILEEWFGRTVIHSDRRFTYAEAQEIIETGRGDYAEEVLTLNRLAQALRKERFKNGAISFDREEVKFRLDENGKPLGVYFKEQKESNQMIEEFMLLANRRVAEFCGKRRTESGRSAERTMVYRVHDTPSEEKLDRFRQFILRFGHIFKATKGRAVAKELNKLFKQIKGTTEENAVATMAVRSMAKAYYTTDNIGHYGLAFPYYTHFTSPIRRYPDMMVHRLLARYLAGGKPADKTELEDLCARASDREVVAAEAERASIKYKMVEFMKEHIGEEFEGHISGLTEWGVYVELDETHIEGMSFLRDIEGDFFTFDEQLYEIIGRSTGIRMTLGSPVRIRVKRADLQKRQLDFELLLPGAAARRTEEPRGKGPKVRTSSRRKGR